MASRIAGETLVDEVAREIGQIALTGKIKPGEHLRTSQQLATRFDVGLSTVHEAIQTLSGLGKLASREDDGAFVDADLAFDLADAPASKNELPEQFHQLSQKLVVGTIQEKVGLRGVKGKSIRLQRAAVAAVQEGEPVDARRAAICHSAYIDHLLTRYSE